MSYQKILDALNQELTCVDRAIGFLTKAGGSSLASTNGDFHRALEHAASEDGAVEVSMRTSAQVRASKRELMVAELREEQTLLMNAMDSIQILAERLEY